MYTGRVHVYSYSVHKFVLIFDKMQAVLFRVYSTVPNDGNCAVAEGLVTCHTAIIS